MILWFKNVKMLRICSISLILIFLFDFSGSSKPSYLEYESLLSRYRYYYFKRVSIRSLEVAMELCPKKSRLLTLQSNTIIKDMEKMIFPYKSPRIILAVANRSNTNSWIFDKNLYVEISESKWQSSNHTLAEEECAFINLKTLQWDITDCDGEFELICIQEYHDPVWLVASGKNVMHNNAVPKKQAKTSEECMALCQYLEDLCIAIVHFSPHDLFECWLVKDLQEKTSVTTSMSYLLRYEMKKISPYQPTDGVYQTQRKKSGTMHRIKRQNPAIAQDVEMETIHTNTGPVNHAQHRKSKTETIYIASVILCSSYVIVIFCFRGIIYIFRFLKTRSETKDDTLLQRKQDEMATKLGDDDNKFDDD